MLIDPPYEDRQEFGSVIKGLKTAHARFPTGVLAAWYPIKHQAPVRDFLDAMEASGIRDIVTAEFWVREPLDPARLNGCGLLVVNPPYRFEAEVPAILSALLDRIGARETGEGWDLERVVDE